MAPTQKQMQDRIAELEQQLAAASAPKPLHCKVSAKGAVSLYGMNSRFPVTLYAEQWQRLSGHMPNILAFIEAHKAELSFKNGSAE